jgi:multiple sugar transport system substrate-binding protein
MHPTRILPLFLLLILILSACGTSTPTASTPAGQSTVTGTPAFTPTFTPSQAATVGVDPAALHGLTIQVWHAFSGASKSLFTSQVSEFNASNQWGIIVSPTGYGDYSSLSDAVGTALGSGQVPDMVAALPEQTLAWDAAGAVVNLNPYLVDPTWGLTQADIAEISPIFWSQDSLNGKRLGLPAQRSARFLFYNKTWAGELGFSQPPATADEFRQQACAANASFLKDRDPSNDGFGGWVVDTNWQTVYSWLLAFGGGATNGNIYTFRTDPNLAALQFIKGLYDKHCAWLSTEPTPFDSFARRSALFVSGDLAEIAQASESMTRLKNSDEWTVIPFPGAQGKVVVAYGSSYTLLKTTPERQLAAWLFARWLLSPDNQAQWVEGTGLFPLRSSVTSLIGPYQAASPQWVTAVGELSAAQDVPQLASWGKVRYVLADGLAVVFQANTKVDQLPSVLDQMDAMAQELNK